MEMQLLNEEDKKVNLLAERITEYFIRNGITTEEMREENIYGLEVLMGKLLSGNWNVPSHIKSKYLFLRRS